jgi:hypothetical protein
LRIARHLLKQIGRTGKATTRGWRGHTAGAGRYTASACNRTSSPVNKKQKQNNNCNKKKQKTNSTTTTTTTTKNSSRHMG